MKTLNDFLLEHPQWAEHEAIQAFERYMKQQEPKESEGLSADATSCLLSEKLDRLRKIPEVEFIELKFNGDYWSCGDPQSSYCLFGEGKTPLEAVQALEEQLKEGD